LLSRVVEQNQPEQCTLIGYEEYKFTPSGKAYTVASVTQQGRVGKIKVYQGSGLRLTPDKIGQILNFNLKSYQAQNSNIYISGFWQDKAQNASQQPPQAAQGMNLPTGMGYTQLLERIAIALEKIADNGQSFEQKYDLKEGDCPI